MDGCRVSFQSEDSNLGLGRRWSTMVCVFVLIVRLPSRVRRYGPDERSKPAAPGAFSESGALHRRI